MSYDTWYELEIERWDQDAGCSTEVEGLRRELDRRNLEDETLDRGCFTVGMFLEGDAPGQSISWYEHKQELEALSAKYPDWLFTLRGWGEDSEDIWTEWYHAGLSQREKVSIVYPELDRSKLEVPSP